MTKLAAFLYEQHLLDEQTIAAAIEAAKESNTPITSYIVKQDLVDSQLLLKKLAHYFSLPIFDLQQHLQNKIAYQTFSAELISRYRALPIEEDKSNLTLCVADPTKEEDFSAICFYTGKSIKLMLGDETLLDKILTTHYRPHILLSRFLAEEEQTYHLEAANHDDEPIIEYVNHLIINAINKHASDIHIEPFNHHYRIRIRQDGMLTETATLPLSAGLRVTTRIKVMANLNIAERRLPQDGRITWRNMQHVDIRLNSMPTLHGEKIVMRLLNYSALQLDIMQLGLHSHQLEILRKIIKRPQGLILITGPTGSGKSITLYSILAALNQTTINISSVEDPIEIELYGINQININYKIGLTFPIALRMLLRQDPDVLMIGEIRDTDTAAIAMQAAQTGHLVLSTLHTTSQMEALPRLQSLGIILEQLPSSSALIIAQRLVRTLCRHCKKFDAETNTYQATRCEHCQSGYQGRTAIFAFNESLWEAAKYKIREGITTPEEVARVIAEDNDDTQL